MDVPFEKLPNESVCVDVPCSDLSAQQAVVLLSPSDGRPVPISLTMTTFRVHIQPHAPSAPKALPISIPLMAVESYGTSQTGQYSTLNIVTKHVWTFTIGFRSVEQHRQTVKTFGVLIQPQSLLQLPAFEIFHGAVTESKKAIVLGRQNGQGSPARHPQGQQQVKPVQMDAAPQSPLGEKPNGEQQVKSPVAESATQAAESQAAQAAQSAAHEALHAAANRGGFAVSSDSDSDDGAALPSASAMTSTAQPSEPPATNGDQAATAATTAATTTTAESTADQSSSPSTSMSGLKKNSSISLAATMSTVNDSMIAEIPESDVAEELLVGWTLFDMERDSTRQLCFDPNTAVPNVLDAGVTKDLRPWFRCTRVGQPENNYGTLPTYPLSICAPNLCSDADLHVACGFRSRQRIPAISFVHLGTGAVLARCSQPMLRQNDTLRYADSTLCRALAPTYSEVSTKPRSVPVAPTTTSAASPNHQTQGTFSPTASGTFAPAPGAATTPSVSLGATPIRHQDPHHDAAPVRRPSNQFAPPPSLVSGSNGNLGTESKTSTRGFVPPPSLVSGSTWGEAPKAGSAIPEAEKDTAVAAPSGADPTTTSPTMIKPAPTATASLQPARYLIVQDLRPKAAATGNMAMGGGYESGPYYEFCRVSFAGIDNIHGLNSAFTKLRQIVATHMGKGGKGGEFWSQFESSQWPQLVQRVLIAGSTIADHLARGESVLTHCTDGWDRTSQATSIAMLLLDPYYRTVRGFCILVEREFCTFGHKFAERSGHEVPGETCGTAHLKPGTSSSDVDNSSEPKRQKSPIFLQFLDCVHQLCVQFPDRFEFSTKLLEFLSVHVYSCFFGTFLVNGAKERTLEGVTRKTISVWSLVEEVVAAERAAIAAATSASIPPAKTATEKKANAWVRCFVSLPSSARNANGAPSTSSPTPEIPSAGRARRDNTTDSDPSDSDLDTAAESAAADAPSPTAPVFLNPLYDGAQAAPFLSRRAGCGLDLLRPSLGLKRVQFWADLYFKYDPDHWSLGPNALQAALARIPRRAAEAREHKTLRHSADVARAAVPEFMRKSDIVLANRDVSIGRKAVQVTEPPAVDTKAKECWNCHERFSLFRGSVACVGCGRLHCGKCLKEKRCASCSAMMDGILE